MTEAELRSIIATAIYQIMDRSSHTRLATVLAQDDFEFDQVTESSLVLTELCFQIEEVLGIEIETNDLFENPRLSHFIKQLQAKLAAANA